jgi:MFS transporter, MHS family, alpha-ketoglutarate permease
VADAAAMTPAPPKDHRRRLGGQCGRVVRYAAFIVYFAPVLSREGSSTAQLLVAAAIFAVGFVMRPV